MPGYVHTCSLLESTTYKEEYEIYVLFVSYYTHRGEKQCIYYYLEHLYLMNHYQQHKPVFKSGTQVSRKRVNSWLKADVWSALLS